MLDVTGQVFRSGRGAPYSAIIADWSTGTIGSQILVPAAPRSSVTVAAL